MNVLADLRFLPGDAIVAPAAGDQAAPAIARGSSSTLTVWADFRANPYGGYEYETSRDLYGVRLDAAGIALDPVPLAIVAGRANQNYPKIAWNGSNWLVVFQSVDAGGTGYYQSSLEAVRVSPTGQVLDARPIKLHGLTPSGPGYWALASDGNNWVVVNQSTSTSGDIVAVRISPAGVVLDPPTRALVKETYFMRSNLKLAYAGGVFLCTFNDSSDTKFVRFDTSLSLLTPTPASFSPASACDLAGNGAGFYVIWNRQEPDYSVHVVGSRVSTAGALLDGGGVNLSGTKQPYAYAAESVTWDGVNWRIMWGEYATNYVARVTSAGTLLDPGSVAVPGVPTGPIAGNGAGGLQVVSTVYTNGNNDIFGASISAGNTAGPIRALSVGAPQQWRPDVAASGTGFLITYLSSTAAGNRVLAQPLDAAGNPLTAEPVQLDAGPSLNGPGNPNVAWNGSVYLVAWSTTNGVVAQRLSVNGAKLDAAPFMVMSRCFGPADVAAINDTFLVVARRYGYTPQYIDCVAARVRGSDGVVLDPAPLFPGGGYVSRPPVVTALGGRFYVAFISNWSHDDSGASTVGAFVPVTGTNITSQGIHLFSTAGGNGIFELGLASKGDSALLVQSAEVTSGVENDMIGWLIASNGSASAMINFTPWPGNQYRPRVAWDGINFVIAYQEQKNRLALNTLDQLDARSDLFAMRVSPTGAKLDPQGFVFSALPTAETDPTVCALNGTLLLAGAVMKNDSLFANYRIAYDILPGNGPVTVLNASATAGDIPLVVNFNATGSSMMLLSYAWDFGDGVTATGPNPTHTFNVAGEYLVTLTTTDEFGRRTTQAQMIEATKPNQVPLAIAIADKYSGNAPLDVVFSAAQSYDPDGVIGNIEWLFSDGGSYWGATAYHTFSTTGNQTVTLRCYDVRGGIGTTNLTINVGGVNQPPIAKAGATPATGSVPLTVQFSSAGSSDPDGTIVEYQWTFGDAFGVISREANPVYTYAYTGAYTATLTVWDNNNVSRSDSVLITVNPASGKVLRSTAINLSGGLTGGRVTVNGQVFVKDANNVAVSGCTVKATWTKPKGTTANQTATTDANGRANFSTTAGYGNYKLTVTSLSKTGYTFDSANSVLSRTFTLLPVLSTVAGGQSLRLSWPTNALGLKLQAQPIGQSSVWTDVAQTPQVSGTNLTVTIPVTGSGQVFRLVEP